MFLDPTASHLIISTNFGENFYLHSQSKTPKILSRLKGVSIESIAWNPLHPTASTREILLGTTDGNIYETFIEPSPEYFRREEKYVKGIYKMSEGPVVGIWTDELSTRPYIRRILLATPKKLLHFVGKPHQHAHEGSGSIFAKIFEGETPVVHENEGSSAEGPSQLAISPEQETAFTETSTPNRNYAWLSSQGVFHGELLSMPDAENLGNLLFAESKSLPRSHIPASVGPSGRPKATQEPSASMILSPWHIIQLIEGRIVITNRLDDSVVLDQLVLESGQTALGLFSDLTKNTFWLVTSDELFEIAAHDESRDIWKIMLKAQKFDAASQFAKTPAQKDAVATASGDFLVNKKQYMEAATVYGRSTKPFEQVALTFIDNGEQDALRKYLLTKLSTLKKSSVMQRMMVTAWLIELYMAKLNILDDTITTKAELAEGMNTAESKDQLSVIRQEFQEFVNKYKNDLDIKTTYEVISSHGREEELLYFATVVDDYSYVLAYWIQRDRWEESLAVIKKQTNPVNFYKYSSVLMATVPDEFVDILMRQSNLDPLRLIPALLNYNKITKVPLNQNQAIRYLNYVINQLHSTDPSIHNTLISIYAASPTKDETALLTYLRAQTFAQEQSYDADFALRLCIQHQRVQSCVHIYTSMHQYARAVALALKHDEIELASTVADRSDGNPALRKKLWLAIAKEVIKKTSGIKAAIEFLKRCELLRIEDLIPFFPDFVVIDDFKEEICQALEEYSQHIDALKLEMDDSALTAEHIKRDIKALDQRYAIVEPGERCYICRLPLLARQFFVFPCQHAFHADCLGKRVVELAGVGEAMRIRKVQDEVRRGVHLGKRRDRVVRELDELVAGAW
jgi:tetratricopeptide (TPR) repeat protein